MHRTNKENWIYVPVPVIIDETLFNAVQEQIAENKKRVRVQLKRGVTHLLQGLLVCKNCGRAYCGYTKKRKDSKNAHSYYRCIGSDGWQYGGINKCINKQLIGKDIESLVWEEVKNFIKNPQRIFDEYQQRLTELEKTPIDHTNDVFEKQKIKLEKGISLLIDSYTQEYINKSEFEIRIKTMRQNLKIIQEQQKDLVTQKNLINKTEIVINDLKTFSYEISSKLDSLDWHGKREVISKIIKRIDIGEEEINIVYKVNQLAEKSQRDESSQHCCRGLDK